MNNESADIRSGTWSDSGQSIRDLMQATLADRLDVIEATCRSVAGVARLQGLGLPSTFAGAVQAWTRPEGLGDPSLGTIEAALDDEQAGALAKRGYQPGPVSYRCRLEPFLHHSEHPVLQRDFHVTADDIRIFGEQSGDLNPLHFDDAFARANGFEGRIAHGMIFSGWLTRLLGTEYPGPGTIFMRNSTVFLAPVYPGRHYAARISTPSSNAEKGTARVVAQLLDGDGKHCLVAYSDVLKRGQ